MHRMTRSRGEAVAERFESPRIGSSTLSLPLATETDKMHKKCRRKRCGSDLSNLSGGMPSPIHARAHRTNGQHGEGMFPTRRRGSHAFAGLVAGSLCLHRIGEGTPPTVAITM